MMENFNKNWLLILLTAVIFGALGFLLGRTTGSDGHYRMMKMRDGEMKELQISVDDDDGEGIVKIDTIKKDGKQIIIKEVKKIK
ncbi:MAG: hypothetical protein ACKVQV_04725 [Bacteroidia bacterium]